MDLILHFRVLTDFCDEMIKKNKYLIFQIDDIEKKLEESSPLSKPLPFPLPLPLPLSLPLPMSMPLFMSLGLLFKSKIGGKI